MKREALWIVVADVKYDTLRGDWCSKKVWGGYDVGVWKCIRSVKVFLNM